MDGNCEKNPIKYLSGIASPEDLKKIPKEELPALAEEIRSELVRVTAQNGGHLASNLGVVEMTVAVHRVFDAPKDHIIFDVGHQSYVHKLLTGRKERFDTLRQAGGISGFTKRAESAYDPFGAGHSSTAISAAIGMAEADALVGSDAYTVAVVGDGALTGGLAYEGLNNCRRNLRLVVIINENEMSISPNTGRLAQHLSRLRASHNYLRTKEVTSGALRYVPLVGRPIYRILRRAKRRIKHLFYNENLFEHMGIRYLGPVDGNDQEGLEACLRHARRLGCSVILHVKTQKGKGYDKAEENPDLYHSLPPAACTCAGETFSAYMGRTLCELAEQNEKLVAITAAMSHGTGLECFRKAHPCRFFDVGIAEGHAVTFASGLAAGGMHPVVALYSTFLQRAYDNVLHDAALQQLPLLLCVDRAGLNAADGATHHGIFDVSLLSAMPNVRIYAPITHAGLRTSLTAALAAKEGVYAIRYPSGCEDATLVQAFYPYGRGENEPLGVRVWQSRAGDVALTVVTHGRIAREALEAARALDEAGVPVRVLLCEYLAPYAALSAEIAPLLAGGVLFLEEEVRAGGFGMNLADALLAIGAIKHQSMVIIATENGFVTPKTGENIRHAAGVDAAAICRAAEKLLKRKETE